MFKSRLLLAGPVVGTQACLRTKAMMVGVLRSRDSWTVVNHFQVLVIGLWAEEAGDEGLAALPIRRLMR